MDVCVIGLGTIGLPIACVLAVSGHDVLGVDIDSKRLKDLAQREIVDVEAGLDVLLTEAFSQKRLKIADRAERADVYLLAVPTRVGENFAPDISHLEKAIMGIQDLVEPGNLLIIESTCPIGTTEKIARQLHTYCSDVRIAYCPERILPGNLLDELIYSDRMIGGIDEASTECAASFYEPFVKGKILKTNARMAEAVKISENSYRDVNIAFANQLSMIADRLGLNAHEIIRLANYHPRVNILSPGVGVGGYCITTNSWFLAQAAPDLAPLTIQARAINTHKTDWVIQKIKEVLHECNTSIIACLGLTYKPEVSDIRESPALSVVEELENEFEVLRVDPYVTGTEPLLKAIARVDVVAVLVAHKLFATVPKENFKGKILLDFAGGCT